MTEPSDSFFQRLQLVLERRSSTPWAVGLGWNTGTMHNVRRGHVPGPELLLRAARAENLNLDWWLEGRGTPFRVTRCLHEAEACAALQPRLAESPAWEVHVIRTASRAALVLTRDDQVLFDAEEGADPVHYTEVEVIAGAIGTEAISLALPKPARPIDPSDPSLTFGYEVLASAEQLAQLVAGRLGTYRLTGTGWKDLDFEPLLRNRRRLEDPQAYAHGMAWESGVEDRGVEILTLDERQLLEDYRLLSPLHRQNVVDIAGALALPVKQARGLVKKP